MVQQSQNITADELRTQIIFLNFLFFTLHTELTLKRFYFI